MPTRPSAIVLTGIVVAGFVAVSVMSRDSGPVRADDPGAASAAPAPVEDDMHEFMEYVFQPTYLRLQAAMAEEPADNAGWKAIKSDSLILAEGGNLLLIRPSEEAAGAWNEHSVAVRELGGELYGAAKAKDYASARRHYTAMLVRCNGCHDDFADGEHQLAP